MTELLPYRSSIIFADYYKHTKPHSVKYKDGLTFYLFRLQVDGTCRALVAGKYETVIPGDLLMYSPDEPYELHIQPHHAPESDAIQPVGDYFLAGKGDWLDAWWAKKGPTAKVNIGFDDTVITLWKYIIGENQKVMQNKEEILDYLLRTFCLTLEQAIQLKQHGKEDTAYQLKQFIENHAHEQLNLKKISASVGLSVSRCSHLFKAAFGKSMFAYCIDVKLKLAQQQVLYSNLSLEQVAEKTGFQSYPHFCRVFRERFGHPPGEYRRQFGFQFNNSFK
ncbi:MAG: hypothetical protein K0Q59_3824 [Paenibacillus sp.]|jgi:AraC family transcriptional regulator of arabinose operon|nr:hypothetical protein [Paenibacillus sp.]